MLGEERCEKNRREGVLGERSSWVWPPERIHRADQGGPVHDEDAQPSDRGLYS